jgi:hypothetical protein
MQQHNRAEPRTYGNSPHTYGNSPRDLQQPLLCIKDLPRWVVWKWQKDQRGEWTKVPFIATAPSRHAKNNDPSTWRNHEEACIAVEKGQADGIGYNLLGAPIGAFDIDRCRDPETGRIHPYALDLIKRANSYTEITPSGTGLRIIGTASDRYLHRKLKASNDVISVEFYRNCERYITVSNCPLEGATSELNDIDQLLDTVLGELDERKAPGSPATWDDSVIEDSKAVDLNLLVPLLDENLMALVRDGVPRPGRSNQFFHAVGWLKDLKWSVVEIFALLSSYPRGIAEKYSTSINRLSKETQRAYHKSREKRHNDEADAASCKSDAPNDQKTAKPSGFALFWHGEPTGRALKPWLVKELIPETGTGLAAGQWGACKTFAMLDLAGSIATGLPFAGRDVVRRGGVLFIAAEGSTEIEGRMQGLVDAKLAGEAMAAAAKNNPISADVDLDHLPFAWIEESPHLKTDREFKQLTELARAAAQQMKEKFGVPLVLIIIDTLSASADLVDANDAAEAQRLFNGLNQLSLATGAFVLVVDHFGKTIETGTRGSSAKEGAADVVLALLADRDLSGAISNTQMAVRKLRGGRPGEVTPFDLTVVDVVDEMTGEIGTTCIIKWKPTRDDIHRATSKRIPKSLKIFHDAMVAALAVRGVQDRPYGKNGPLLRVVAEPDLREEFMASYPADSQDAKAKAYKRALRDAAALGLVHSRQIGTVDYLWLPEVETQAEVAF